MLSFYGGQQGKSFAPKEKFDTVYSSNEKYSSLKKDLELGYSSPIKIGEYVLVTYGSQYVNTTAFVEKKKIDHQESNQNFNGTLWQKVLYDSNLKANYQLEAEDGITYILEAHLIGETGEAGQGLTINEAYSRENGTYFDKNKNQIIVDDGSISYTDIENAILDYVEDSYTDESGNEANVPFGYAVAIEMYVDRDSSSTGDEYNEYRIYSYVGSGMGDSGNNKSWAGLGPIQNSGVWYGEEEPPGYYDIWISPDATFEANDYYATSARVEEIENTLGMSSTGGGTGEKSLMQRVADLEVQLGIGNNSGDQPTLDDRVKTVETTVSNLGGRISTVETNINTITNNINALNLNNYFRIGQYTFGGSSGVSIDFGDFTPHVFFIMPNVNGQSEALVIGEYWYKINGNTITVYNSGEAQGTFTFVAIRSSKVTGFGNGIYSLM